MSARRVCVTLALAAFTTFTGVIALAGAAHAAPADTLRLTIDQAVARALANGEEMRIANSQIVQASGRVKEALSPAFPQINGSLTYGRQFASIFQSAVPDTSQLATLFKNSPFGSVHTWTAELTGSQLLWSGGRVGAGLSAARAYGKNVRANRAEVADQLTYEVERAYLEAAVARRVLDITRAGLEQARAHLTQVAAANHEGSRSEYDLIRAQVDAQNEEPQVVAAANASELALLELKRLVDVPLAQPLALDTPLTFDGDRVPVLAETAGAGALDTHRAALAQADADVEGRGDLLKVARAGRWPQVTLSGTLQQQAFPANGWPEVDDFHRNINASVKLEWPLFQGLTVVGGVQRATGELRQSEAQRDQIRESVAIEQARARQEVQRTLAELVARRGTTALAQRAHHLADVRYGNGLATQLEVTDARVQEQTAEIQQVQAIKDYRLALLELERALGRKVTTATRSYDELSADVDRPER